MLDAIPEQLREPTLFAIPFFVLKLGRGRFARRDSSIRMTIPGVGAAYIGA